MFRIWAKLIDDDRKIVKDYLYKSDNMYDENEFFDYLTEICSKLDVSVPTILSYHKKNFHDFSYVKFMKRDFVEEVPYHAMTLEYSVEDKKKKKAF